MKNVPTKIYLQVGPGEEPEDFKGLTEVTWSKDKIYGSDISYTLTAKNTPPKRELFLPGSLKTYDGATMTTGQTYYSFFMLKNGLPSLITTEKVEAKKYYASDWVHTRFADKDKALSQIKKQFFVSTVMVENALLHHSCDRDGNELISQETIKKIMDVIYRHSDTE